jgi:hypothetical protein
MTIGALDTSVYTVPTEVPEADGTLEYVHDHARVDRLLFDGVLDPTGGVLRPDASRPGMGMDLKRTDAERFRKG